MAFIALVPLSVVWRRGSPRDVTFASAGFGLLFFGLLLGWIRLFGIAAFVALILFQTVLLTAALAFSAALFPRTRGGWAPFGFAAAFVAAELLRATVPQFGFTWGGIGYSQHDNPWILTLAAYTGVWGVGFVVVAINGFITEFVLRLKRERFRTSSWLLGAILLLGGPGLLPSWDPDGNPAKIAMVQGNAPELLDSPHLDDVIVLQSHIDLTRSISAEEFSLVIWPESSVDSDPFINPEMGEALFEIVRETRLPFAVGAIIDAPKNRFWNTTLFFDADGDLAGRYEKIHLVPFGEFVPARNLLTPLVKELERVPKDGLPGNDRAVFSISEGRFATVICFESLFPGLVRSFVSEGARFLVVSTNNSSFGRSPASRQHLAFSQLRAAEHRMWLAHTALTGISAVVAPDGQIVESTNLFEPAVLTPEVRFATRVTPYARFGDWFPLAATAFIIGSGFYPRRRRAP